ncbi:hypothetical protein ACFL6F_04220 [Planctomycetota bacterium]
MYSSLITPNIPSQKLLMTASMILLLVVLFGGCATIPVEEPQAKKGVIAINATVFLKGDLLNWFPGTIQPIHAYFVKLDKGADMFKQTKIIRSNQTVGDDMYLLNAEPGTYVAIGLQAVQERDKKEEEKKHAYDNTKMRFFKEVFFPKKLIKMTKVTVKPDSAAYMGMYMVSEPKFTERSKILDDAQKHYYKVVAPMVYKVPGYKVMDDMGMDYRVFGAVLSVFRKDTKYEIKFLKRGMRTFKKSQWVPIFQKKLQELKNLDNE